MRPISKPIVLALLLFFAIAYAYDYASVRRRMNAQKTGDPFDVVTYPHLLAIPQKGNKVDYELVTHRVGPVRPFSVSALRVYALLDRAPQGADSYANDNRAARRRNVSSKNRRGTGCMNDSTILPRER